jgi:hypothetical protein
MIRDGLLALEEEARLDGAGCSEAGGMGTKQIIGIAVGAAAGFLIGYLGRCAGGTA